MSVYSLPTPSNPTGWSKYLKSVIEGLVTAVNDKFSAVDTLVADNKTAVDNAVNAEAVARENADNALQSAIDAEKLRAETAEAGLQSAIDAEKTRAETAEGVLQSNIDALSATVTANNGAFEAWRDANTDEISKEVDAAINERVTQTAYDAVVSALQSKDSELTTGLANAIADREAKDVEHTGKIEKLEAFVQLLLSTYHLQDSSDRVITSVDDIVV